LLVDFLMHILLRYYETTGTTREAKVKETLETMGASMMLGGFTTWLGVIPMALSTTAIFTTIFVAFLAMVTLGLVIGLAFLPALLSVCGPVVCVSTHDIGKGKGKSPSNTSHEMGCPTSHTSAPSPDPAIRKFNPYQVVESKEELDKHPDDAAPKVIPHSPTWVSDDLEDTTGPKQAVAIPDEDEHSHEQENEHEHKEGHDFLA